MAALEGVWPQRPEAKAALVIALKNVLQKPCPEDEQKACECFDLKFQAAMAGSYVASLSGQAEPLVGLAHFVGEVRSRMIANYTNRGSLNPPGLAEIFSRARTTNPNFITTAELKKAYNSVIETNRINHISDKLQMELFSINQTLPKDLIESCSRFSSSNPQKAKLIQEIILAAHLSEEEQRKIQMANVH